MRMTAPQKSLALRSNLMVRVVKWGWFALQVAVPWLSPFSVLPQQSVSREPTLGALL